MEDQIHSAEDLSGDRNASFHTVQPLRDLESNWSVDLAKNLEEYLLKICSGEISGNDGRNVNFAEAALLLQGSIQVYSRKVEYLYTLVLHALEFISHTRQQDQLERTPIQHEEGGSHVVPDEEDDLFWCLDDVPVEPRNCLDSTTSKDASLNQFVKAPANLVVLEGDCLDATGDGGELESYLLATNDLYRDFILLDPCDAVAVDSFLKGDKDSKGLNGDYKSGSLNSKSCKSFQSPSRRSGGTAHRSHGKSNLNEPWVDCSFAANEGKIGPEPPAFDIAENNDGHTDHAGLDNSDDDDDDDDDDDPWKPLNPHEAGNLKVKPFKKVKAFRRRGVCSTKHNILTTQFPLAKMHGPISPELTEIWEKHRACERQQEPQTPPLYEKLRNSLIHGDSQTFSAYSNVEDNKEDGGYDSGVNDFGDEMPHDMYMDDDLPLHQEQHDDGAACFDSIDNLEDLCRSHLDALLANIAETEKQTELAARVSTWKQKIEHDLEEQDLRPPFDIHDYGDRILEKLSHKAENGNVMSFSEVVSGQEKHDVARSFSALLQLVNNEDVNLDRGGTDGESVCYTDANPFYIKLLNRDKRREEVQLRSTKKRAKSPTKKECTKGNRDKSEIENRPPVSSSSTTALQPQPNCKFSVKLGKINPIRCTPERKRRRRSRIAEPVDLHSSR